MKCRKHRLVVEFTTNLPLTESDAARGLALLFENLDLDRAPIWATKEIYGQKLTVKRFSRVYTAERARRRAPKLNPNAY